MKDSWYKKGIVFVILVVMLLIIPSTLATFNPTVVKTLNNNSNSVDKPDLVILDVFNDFDIWWYINALVLNDGAGDIPGDVPRTLRCVVFLPLGRTKAGEYSRGCSGSYPPTPPGETINFILDYMEPKGNGFFKVYFEVDYGNSIDESNENNNVVWAYYKLRDAQGWSPQRLSDLQQVSKIPGSMPRKQATDNMLLLRFLEQFPLIQQLLRLQL